MMADLHKPLEAVSDWVLLSTSSLEHQLYWRAGQLHADRVVGLDTHQLTVYRDEDGQRGSAVTYVGRDAAEVEGAVLAAGLALNPAYRLPAGPVQYPEVELGDEAPDRERLRAYGEALQVELAARGVQVSHLELFWAAEDQALLASNDRTHAWQGTRVLMDLVVAHGEGERASEFRVLRRARRVSDLLPERVLEAACAAVVDRERAQLPPTGRMAVVLPGAELAGLLNAVRVRTSARNLYTGLLQQRVGDRLLDTRGDTITLRANPVRAYAEASTPTDASTVPAAPFALITDGMIAGMSADPQYATYVGLPPTGPVGTLEWEPGRWAIQDLVADGPVLEVLAFSASLPNPLTGDFAGEIKMGYLHEGGRRIPVAQGSVSGNILEALRQCRLSRNAEDHPGYWGPEAVRFETLQVSGAQD
jgi:PmbA protein